VYCEANGRAIFTYTVVYWDVKIMAEPFVISAPKDDMAVPFFPHCSMSASMAEPFLCQKSLTVSIAIHGRAICKFVHFKYGRATSVQKLLTVFIVIHGRATCRFVRSKYGRAISVQKLLTVFFVIHGCAICRLVRSKYGRAISVQKITHCIYRYSWP
jgi:hypothetical protein